MSFTNEFAEIESQKSGFCSGVPYFSIKFCLQFRNPVGTPGGGVKLRLRQRFKRSGYDATTPAQITPALISLLPTILLKVRNPPNECPHIPILSGSTPLNFLIEETAFKTSIV